MPLRLTILALLCSVTCARAAPPDVATAVRDEATVLGFVDGTPLTPAEQATVAAYVAASFARDPKGTASSAGGTAFAVGVIAGHDARKRAIVREMYRSEIEGRAAADAERTIVESHDPAIAYDPKTKFVVTEHTLDRVMAAAAWAARAVGAAPPTPELRADARAVLVAKFGAFDHANQEAYAHIERNVAIAMPVLERESPDVRKAALLRWNHAENGRALLAMTTSALEMTAFQAQQSGGGGGIGNPSLAILHSMTMRNLAQSTWQMRHPECGPAGSNPYSCSGAPILQPIAPPFP